MNGAWFEAAPADAPLSQGDVIRACHVLTWKPPVPSSSLTDWAEARTVDVVVMTQACDLEHHKVRNVVLCRLLALSAYREAWEARFRDRSQNPSEKAWRRTLEDIAAGHVWNEALVERFDHPDVPVELSVVEFQDVSTVPREFLEGLLATRGRSRPRLRPPYREHLSQAFARFFMRVGLPQAVALPG